MEIKLINKTPDFLHTIWTAGRTSHSALTPQELYTLEETESKMLKLVEFLIKSKHLSTLEHCSMTFAVSGVWHGGGVKFLFWGLLHGIYQVIGDLLPMHGKNGKAGTGTGKTYSSDRFLRSAGTFCLVMPAWIIFRADSLRTGLSMIRSIFTVFNPWILTDDSLFRLGLGWKEVILLIVCLLILLAVSLLQEKGVRIRERVLSCSLPVRWGTYIGAVLFIMVFGTYGWGFDARSFIYGGF